MSDNENVELQEESIESSDEREIKLKGLAAQDEALWNDEHTSDEEEFDPEKPEDLKTETAKAEDEDEDEDDEDEDDSIVVPDDVEEQTCADHKKCVKLAEKLDHFIVSSTNFAGNSPRKECIAALSEVVCDHYKCL